MTKILCSKKELTDNIEKFKKIENRFTLPYDFYDHNRMDICYFKN